MIAKLLPAPAAFFAETLSGYTDRLRSAGNHEDHIRREVYCIIAFTRFTARYPWECTRADVDRFGADLTTKFKSSTVRGYQQSLRRYLDYCTDPAYDWSSQAYERFGSTFQQLCVPENTHKHAWLFDGDPGRRAFTDEELRAIFTRIHAQMIEAPRSSHKGALVAARDYAAIATTLGFGLRAREAARLETFDLREQIDPEMKRLYGGFGVVHVRWGKALRRGEPRRRLVLAVPLFEFAVDVLRWYCEEIRPRLPATRPTVLFPTERGSMLNETYLSARFAHWRNLAGIDKSLSLHCLRHTYITRMIEENYPVAFVSDQVGHEDLSVLKVYLHLCDEFKRRTLIEAHKLAV